jgi:hypothetical protein
LFHQLDLGLGIVVGDSLDELAADIGGFHGGGCERSGQQEINYFFEQ